MGAGKGALKRAKAMSGTDVAIVCIYKYVCSESGARWTILINFLLDVCA